MSVISEISALVVAVIFSTLIGGVYVFFIPMFFPGYKAGWILNLGVLLATLLGGYIGLQSSKASSPLIRILLAFCYGAVTAILVYFLSLFFILNVRGS